MSVEDQERLRLAVMKHFYDRWAVRGEEPTVQRVRLETIAQALNEPLTDVRRAVEYLVGVGLLEYKTFGPTIAITWVGVAEVEQAEKTPLEPTTYLPPINILHVEGDFVGGQVMQGSTASSQDGSFRVEAATLELVREWVNQIQGVLTEIVFAHEDDRAEAAAEVSTVLGQLSSPRPKSRILRESLHTLRSLLEGAVSSGAVTVLLAKFPDIVNALPG